MVEREKPNSSEGKGLTLNRLLQSNALGTARPLSSSCPMKELKDHGPIQLNQGVSKASACWRLILMPGIGRALFDINKAVSQPGPHHIGTAPSVMFQFAIR